MFFPAPDNCSKQNAGFSRITLPHATAVSIERPKVIIISPVLTKTIWETG